MLNATPPEPDNGWREFQARHGQEPPYTTTTEAPAYDPIAHTAIDPRDSFLAQVNAARAEQGLAAINPVTDTDTTPTPDGTEPAAGWETFRAQHGLAPRPEPFNPNPPPTPPDFVNAFGPLGPEEVIIQAVNTAIQETHGREDVAPAARQAAEAAQAAGATQAQIVQAAVTAAIEAPAADGPITDGADTPWKATGGRSGNPLIIPGGRPAATEPEPAIVEAEPPEPTIADAADDYVKAYFATRGDVAPDTTNPEEQAAVDDLRPDRWESLARFGLGMASGTSPFFAVNVGNAGLAALDSRDEGMKAYQEALSSMGALNESRRANRAAERLNEFGTAAQLAGTLGRPTATGTDPVLGSQLNMMEELFKQEVAAIIARTGVDPLDPTATPEDMDDVRNQAINNLIKKFPGMAPLLAAYNTHPDVDLTADPAE